MNDVYKHTYTCICQHTGLFGDFSIICGISWNLLANQKNRKSVYINRSIMYYNVYIPLKYIYILSKLYETHENP